jgi:hypothetical protein
MSRFSSAQRQQILSEARRNIAARANVAERESASSHRPEIPGVIYKTRVDDARSRSARALSERSAAAESRSELPWWEWVDQRLEARLEAVYEGVGTAIADYCGPQVAALKRELELVRQEFAVLQQQVGLASGLKALREEVDRAVASVPRVPALVEQLEAGQAELKRELKATKDKLTQTRVNQTMHDYRLSELDKATKAHAAGLEMKLETTVSSFTMRESHPDARAALRNFADEALKGHRGETIWLFDPNPRPRAGAA